LSSKLVKDITIVNIAGQSVIQTQENNILINHLRSGIYLVHIRMSDGSEVVYKFKK
jgi:hypothetical protein